VEVTVYLEVLVDQTVRAIRPSCSAPIFTPSSLNDSLIRSSSLMLLSNPRSLRSALLLRSSSSMSALYRRIFLPLQAVVLILDRHSYMLVTVVVERLTMVRVEYAARMRSFLSSALQEASATAEMAIARERSLITLVCTGSINVWQQ